MRNIFDTPRNRHGYRVLASGVLFIAVISVQVDAGLLVSETYLRNRASVNTQDGILASQTIVRETSPTPIADTRLNAVAGASSQLTRSYNWSGDSGYFRVDAAHSIVIPTANSAHADSTGYINFTTMVDSLISLRVQYAYDLPGSLMEGHGTGGVLNFDTDTLYDEISFGEFSFGPVSGSFDETTYITIPAGTNCQFVFTMRLITYATSVAATENGTFELSITPLPEPASLYPLALAAMLLRRSRK